MKKLVDSPRNDEFFMMNVGVCWKCENLIRMMDKRVFSIQKEGKWRFGGSSNN